VVTDEELRELYARLAGEMRARWDRDLPLEELLSDRWERAARLGFGEGASIYASSYVYGDVTVGPRTWVGPFTLLDGSGGLEIGANCSISAGVQVYSHDTVAWALTGGAREPERGAVRIGDCCFIGSLSVISRGVTVGDHCVLGAHSFLDTDLDPFTFAAGAPARPLGLVELDGDNVRIVRD
jgi:acetyltransferase-like isoleucine patch superfamily enzyme